MWCCCVLDAVCVKLIHLQVDQLNSCKIANLYRKMGFFELLGLIVFLYFIVNIFLWLYLDSDIELFVCEKVGKPIGKELR